AFDKFASRYMALGALPWAPDEIGKRIWTDTDDSGIQWYIENRFDITGKDKVLDCVLLSAEQHAYNPVTDYLDGLMWDGVKRLDTLFIDYLGAEDNAYTRAACRKTFVAAVARAYHPGCKYDTMPVLVGLQGMGKSSLIRIMGREWYADGLNAVEGKEAAENIQGRWLIEAGEMAGFSRAEENAVKQFLSRQVDNFRKAYGRRTQEYPRQCVFFGTTNQHEFLKDTTGNRRFWPIQVGVIKPTKNVFCDLEGEVDNLWAEAVAYFRQGESLIIEDNEAVLALANEAREAHREGNAKAGVIEEFLKRKIPPNWNTMSVDARRMFLRSTTADPSQKLTYRDRICAAEVWCECFDKEL
ncbi:MAG: virulence-associated protein E, partial [Megasphaera micronuciformis]|nr:virulence-associated protein E [Megasphaera micronuciformis]